MDSRPRDWWRALVVLAFVALALRIGAALFSGSGDIVYEYQLIAQNLLDGQGIAWDDCGEMPLQATSLFPPLYIYWCALFMGLFPGTSLPLYIAQGVVAALGVFPAFALGRRLFSVQVGGIFALLYAVYPELILLSARPVPEFAYVVVFLAMAVLYVRLAAAPPGSRGALGLSLALGGIAGLGALLKEGTLVLLAAIFLALLWQHALSRRFLATHMAPALVVVFVMLLPWAMRNYRVQGELIFVRTGFGLNLWKGNHEDATGTARAPNGWDIRYWPPEKMEHLEARLPDDEQARDRWFAVEAMRFIREHPGRYAQLCLKRLWYFVAFDPYHPLTGNALYRYPYLLALVAGLAGAWLAARARRLDPLLPLTVLAILALYVPVLYVPRYRIIPLVVLLLLAAYALAWVRERSRHPTVHP